MLSFEDSLVLAIKCKPPSLTASTRRYFGVEVWGRQRGITSRARRSNPSLPTTHCKPFFNNQNTFPKRWNEPIVAWAQTKNNAVCSHSAANTRCDQPSTISPAMKQHVVTSPPCLFECKALYARADLQHMRCEESLHPCKTLLLSRLSRMSNIL
jgi:hypothetical protein